MSKGCKSCSQVIEGTLELLQNRELEEACRFACADIESAWDVIVADRFASEAWATYQPAVTQHPP